MGAGPLVKAELYDGAYGLTIRIDVPSSEALLLLKDVFRRLAEGRIDACSLHELPFMESRTVQHFDLKAVSSTPERTVELRTAPDGSVSVCWANPLEGWKRCEELLDGILETGIPAHQYLSEEGIDDAIIVVAFQESSHTWK